MRVFTRILDLVSVPRAQSLYRIRYPPGFSRRHDSKFAGTRLLGHKEVSGDVRADHPFEVLRRVVGEGLRKVDSGVVDEKVDAVELFHGGIGHPRGRLLLADVPIHEEETRRGLQILRLADRARIGDDTMATLEKRTG